MMKKSAYTLIVDTRTEMNVITGTPVHILDSSTFQLQAKNEKEKLP